MSKPLPRWVRFWLPLVVLAVAGAAGVAALLAGGEPEPIGIDREPIPAETTGRDGVLSFTVVSLDCGFENVIAEERIPATGQFCLVELQVSASVSEEQGRVDPSCQFLITRRQERFVADEHATLLGVDRGPFLEGIRPGQLVEMELMFDIPKEEAAAGVELHSSCDSDGVRLTGPPDRG